MITIKNEGATTITSGKFYFQIDGDVVQIFNWSGSLAPQLELDVMLPVQSTLGGVHSFDVTFSNTNGLASDNNTVNDSRNTNFFAYDGGASATLPFTEDFENSFPAANWSVYNPNSDATWVKNTLYGGFGTSPSCVAIDNFSYGINPNKKRDALLTAF